MQEIAAKTLPVAELETERLQLSDVLPHPDNPRIHSPEQIEAIMNSLMLDGYIAGSMGIQRSRRRLYKGHGVYEALQGLRCIEADFVVKDLTDAETLALLARDNALSDMSSNDPVKLKAISVELQSMSVPIERMGYTMRQINSMQTQEPIDPSELWNDMPEFEQEDVVYRSFHIHFSTQKDIDEFAKLIGQKITDKARYIWFPEVETPVFKEFECIDDES